MTSTSDNDEIAVKRELPNEGIDLAEGQGTGGRRSTYFRRKR